MESKQIEHNIKELLEEPFWLSTLDTHTTYLRFEDDSHDGCIAVQFSQDGDGWIEVLSKPDKNDFHVDMRFRMPFVGDGQSSRVRNALLILAEAIRLDDEDKPQDRG